MKTIYVVIVDELVNFVKTSNEIVGFESEEDARARLNELIGAGKELASESGWIEEQGTNWYETFPEGLYAEDHYSVELRIIGVE